MKKVTEEMLSRRTVIGAAVPVVVGTVCFPTLGAAQTAAKPATKPPAPAPGKTPAAPAAAAALTKLDPKEPTAVALRYVEDAKKVDPKKNPTFKPGQLCSNCFNIQGKAGEKFRPCSIFPKKLVASEGWCSVWAKKPGT